MLNGSSKSAAEQIRSLLCPETDVRGAFFSHPLNHDSCVCTNNPRNYCSEVSNKSLSLYRRKDSAGLYE